MWIEITPPYTMPYRRIIKTIVIHNVKTSSVSTNRQIYKNTFENVVVRIRNPSLIKTCRLDRCLFVKEVSTL